MTNDDDDEEDQDQNCDEVSFQSMKLIVFFSLISYLYNIFADYNPNHDITDCHSEKKEKSLPVWKWMDTTGHLPTVSLAH